MAERKTRSDEVDVLRGAALLGLCVVNVPFFAGIDPVVPPSAPADRVAAFAVATLFQGKFFVLFSFLFGWGFGIGRVPTSTARRPSGTSHGRRLSALFLIGVAHALLVFTGDILVLYALLGALLWTLRDAAPRHLLDIAVAALAVAAIALAGLGILLDEVSFTLDAAEGHRGSFADGVRERLREWPFAFGFVLVFNGPIAFAAFCAGLAAARCGFLEPRAASYEALRRRWPPLLGAGLVLNGLYASSAAGLLGDGAGALLAFASLAIGGPCLASVYLIAVVELVRRTGVRGSFASAGRLSLSAYVAQGVVAGLLFNGYGAGWYGRVGDAACLAVAVLIHAGVHALCAFWWRRFGPGPLERILRAATRAGRADGTRA